MTSNGSTPLEHVAVPAGWDALQGFPHVAYALDRALRFRCVNGAWDRFAVANGARGDQLSTRIVGQPFLAGLREPERSHWQAILEKLLRGQLPHHVEEIPCDGPGITRRIVVTASPTRDASHTIDGVLFVNYDVTAARAKEVDQARLAAIVNSSDDAIIGKSLDGTIASWNPGAERMYGYTAAEAVGRSIRMLVPPARADEITEILIAVGRGESIRDVETVRVRKDGRHVAVSLAVSPICDADGTLVGAATIARDISERVRSEAALRERDEELRLAVDTARLGTWRLDLSSGRFDISERCKEMFGRPPAEQVTYEGWLSLIHREDRQAVEAAFTSSVADGSVYEAAYRIVLPDGVERCIVATGRVVHSDDGAPTRMVGVVMDVTERVRADDALRRSEERYRGLIEDQPDLVTRMRPDGTLTFVNRACAAYYGTTPEALVGGNVFAMVSPDDAAALRRAIDLLSPTAPLQTTLQTVSGEDGCVRWQQWTNRGIFGRDGRLTEVQGVGRDITEQRRAETALRTSEERFRTIARATSDALWDWDVQTNALWWGGGLRTLFGHEPEVLDTSLASWLSLIHPDDVARVQASIHAILETTETSWSDTYRFRRADGTYAEVHDRGEIIREADGTPVRAVGGMIDITEQRQIEHALAELNAGLEQALLEAQELAVAAKAADRAKSEFLAMMSHEIRTPLNGVIGMTGLLMETPMTAEQREFAETIRGCGEALLNTINHVLDFSKIEAGKLTLETTACDPGAIAEEVTSLLAGQAAEKQLELAMLVEVPGDHHFVGDTGRIRQVLLNLVANAVKFTEAGAVTVRVRLDEQTGDDAMVRFDVVDTGIGIAPQVLSRLFHPFVQADGSTTRRYGGTGLGLAICKRLVEMMGGQVGAESQLGSGSTFWFTVRLARDGEAATTGSPATELHGRRMLVVDDNAVNRRVLACQLAAWGVTADAVPDGPSALRALRQAANAGQPYGIAILDMQMPDMDGLALARAISADPTIAGIPLVLLTSLGQTVVHAENMGIHACLTKPARPSVLRAILARAMSPSEADGPSVLTPEPGGKVTTAARILLAEDNVVNQKVAVRMLEKLGYRVDVVGDGREAVEALRRIPYAAILMDCQMPELDGYEATAAIRRQEGDTRHTPIIAMTAAALSGDRERCLDAGMDDYVSKPVRPDALADTLARWVPASLKRAVGACER